MQQDNITVNVKQNYGQKWAGDVTIAPNATGLELKQKLAVNLSQEVNSFKLLCCGKFIKPELTLDQQKVKNNSKIIVMPQQSDSNSSSGQQNIVQKTEEEVNRTKRLMKVVQSIADREYEDDRHSVEIVNQHGVSMQLLPLDKKHLKIGMTMHDKGKRELEKASEVKLLITSLQNSSTQSSESNQTDQNSNASRLTQLENQRREKLKSALEYFLIADSEGFSKVSKDILNMVDNYGLLCLDVVWIYFQLSELSTLSDAQWRLSNAESVFNRTYGPNLERLKVLKPNAANAELVTICRLYLLQGISSFHSDKIPASISFFAKADSKLSELNIPEQDITMLMSMGFSFKDARIALRSSSKNVERAVEFALNRREEKQREREEEMRKRKERREQRQYGKTISGKNVDLTAVKNLMEMGFEKECVIEALRQTDNDLIAASNQLTENIDVIRASIAQQREERSNKKSQLELERALKSSLEAEGEKKVEEEKGDAGKMEGVEEEGKMEGVEEEGGKMEVEESEEEKKKREEEERKNERERKRKEEEERRKREELEMEETLERELLEAVETDAEAHLDVSLEEELEILAQYKKLIAAKILTQPKPK